MERFLLEVTRFYKILIRVNGKGKPHPTYRVSIPRL